MKSQFAMAVLLIALAVAAPAAARSSPSSDARQMLDLINAERRNAGLSPLAWDSRLAAAAQQHTGLLVLKQQISHQFRGEPPLKKRLADVPLDHSGENVGLDQSIPRAHEAFMRSPGHRENIMDPTYNAVGIAVQRDRSGLWITEDFAHLIPEVSQSEAVRQAAEAFARERARSKAPRLYLRNDGRVQDVACSMARKDKLNSRAALKVPGATYVATYTSMDPAELPDDVLRLRSVRGVNSYSVGACFARTPHYPSGAYWMVMVMFDN